MLSGHRFFNPIDTQAKAMNLTSSQLTKIAIGLGACFAVYKFVDHQAAKAMALGVAGVIVGRNVPYVKDAL